MTHKTSFGLAAFIGFLVAMYFGSKVVGDMQSFNDWDKPKEISRLIDAGVVGSLAALASWMGNSQVMLARIFPMIFGSGNGGNVPTEGGTKQP